MDDVEMGGGLASATVLKDSASDKLALFIGDGERLSLEEQDRVDVNLAGGRHIHQIGEIEWGW